MNLTEKIEIVVENPLVVEEPYTTSKISKNICFYFKQDRIQYINRIIEETNKYNLRTDIFIHTHLDFSLDLLTDFNNGNIKIIHHDLSNDSHFNSNPFIFPYYIRDFIKKQENDYDIFIYVEDDILIKKEALLYWLEYKDKLIKNNYNLGFFRIEVDDKGDEYTTDNSTSPDGTCSQYLSNTVTLDDELFIINDANPYCAFWIYDKIEFRKYINSDRYNDCDWSRECVAFGLHMPGINWYKGTIIPLQNNKLPNKCRVYHMPNNYVHRKDWWVLHRFNEVVKL